MAVCVVMSVFTLLPAIKVEDLNMMYVLPSHWMLLTNLDNTVYPVAP